MICSRCNVDKDLSLFYKDKTQPLGIKYHCKLCSNKETKNYTKNNQDIIKNISKRYYEKNKKNIISRNVKYEKSMKNIHLEKNLWRKAKYRAKSKNLEFNISLEDIIVPENCPVLDTKLEVSNIKRTGNSPSLDRIDNSKGYVKGNVIVISFRANRIKSDASIDELEKIANFYKGKI